jgi:nucleoside-diphosphate kinase
VRAGKNKGGKKMKEPIFIMVKPDGLVKSLTGNILTKLSEAKFEIIAAKIVRVDKELAEEHYRHLKEESNKVREIVGATNPEEAHPVSIRGAYGRITTSGIYENVVHASSDPAEAEREIKLWFSPEEIIFDLYPTKVVDKKIQKKAWK